MLSIPSLPWRSMSTLNLKPAAVKLRAPGHRDHRFHGILITQNGAS